jgi:hypothetical protein
MCCTIWNEQQDEAGDVARPMQICNARSFGFCINAQLNKTKTAPQLQQQLIDMVKGGFEQKGAIDKYLTREAFNLVLLFSYI